MKSIARKLILTAGVTATLLSAQSCMKDTDSYYIYYPNAIVTVKQVPGDTAGCYLQLDDSTTLIAENMPVSPFGNREVRALTSIQETGATVEGYDKVVHVFAIDSILTKSTVQYTGEPEITNTYGDDPVAMINDWMTVVEDGYITLRFRVRTSGPGTIHKVNLLTNSTDDPYLLEFRHKIEGASYPDEIHPANGYPADGLVAFRLDDLPDTNGETVKITLKWKSFDEKYHTAQFDYCTGKSSPSEMRIESSASFLTGIQ